MKTTDMIWIVRSENLIGRDWNSPVCCQLNLFQGPDLRTSLYLDNIYLSLCRQLSVVYEFFMIELCGLNQLLCVRKLSLLNLQTTPH
jgi:hypothetical protein